MCASMGCVSSKVSARTVQYILNILRQFSLWSIDTRSHSLSLSLALSLGLEVEEASTYAARNEPWLQTCLQTFGSGIRRAEQERIILWINYTSAGVVPGKKLVFTIEQATQILHSFPRTAAAVVLLPNRAADLRSSPKWLGNMVNTR